MSVAVVNLSIEKGTDFEASFSVLEPNSSPAALYNYSGAAKIRKHPTSSEYKSFSVTITAATGKVKITMARSVTSELKSGRNYYDILLTDNVRNTVTKVVEGSIIVSESISS